MSRPLTTERQLPEDVKRYRPSARLVRSTVASKLKELRQEHLLVCPCPGKNKMGKASTSPKIKNPAGEALSSLAILLVLVLEGGVEGLPMAASATA